MNERQSSMPEASAEKPKPDLVEAIQRERSLANTMAALLRESNLATDGRVVETIQKLKVERAATDVEQLRRDFVREWINELGMSLFDDERPLTQALLSFESRLSEEECEDLRVTVREAARQMQLSLRRIASKSLGMSDADWLRIFNENNKRKT